MSLKFTKMLYRFTDIKTKLKIDILQKPRSKVVRETQIIVCFKDMSM